MTLEFIIVNDKARSMETMWHAIDETLELSGIYYHRTSTSERALVTGKLNNHSPIPTNAVLYVHGNLQSRYENIGLTIELAKQRPDLRFVIQLDPFMNREWYFAHPDNVLFTKERLENQTLDDQIIVVTEDFFEPTFFRKGAKYQPRIDVYLQEVTPKIAVNKHPQPVVQKRGYHIYFIHNEPEKLGTIKDHLQMFLDERKCPYTITVVPESCLDDGMDEDRRSFPEDALLLIHGNMFERYRNLKRVRELELQEPNLRYILFLDRRQGESFQSEDDYEMAKGFLELGFDPARRINVLLMNIATFVYGKPSSNFFAETDNFETYLQAWQQQRNP